MQCWSFWFISLTVLSQVKYFSTGLWMSPALERTPICVPFEHVWLRAASTQASLKLKSCHNSLRFFPRRTCTYVQRRTCTDKDAHAHVYAGAVPTALQIKYMNLPKKPFDMLHQIVSCVLARIIMHKGNELDTIQNPEPLACRTMCNLTNIC